MELCVQTGERRRGGTGVPPVMLLLTIVISVVGCRPVEDDAGPRIAVDACATNETEACTLEFGERDISVRVQDAVVVSNASLTSPLTLSNVELIGDPAFRLVDIPNVIAPRDSETIVIDVRPNVEAVLETRLIILSDATNGPSASDVEGLVSVAVTVTGVNNGVPDIDVEPAACVFDEAASTCAVSVENFGNRELVIDALRVTCDGTCPFSVADDPGAPIAPGVPLVVEVSFTPSPGSFSGTLAIISSDPDENILEIPLSATSN